MIRLLALTSSPQRTSNVLNGKRLHEIIRKLVEWESTDESKPAVRILWAKARYEIARSVARTRGETAPTDPAEVLNYLREHTLPII